MNSIRDSLGLSNDLVIAKVMCFVEQNYHQDIKLVDVARKFHYSPSYFSRVFKKIMGCSFQRYLTEMRMDQARRLLLYSDKQITEIAERVGYNDARYFGQVFKQYEGHPPKNYRLLHIDPFADLDK